MLWRHHLLLGSVPEEAKSPSLKAVSRAFFFSKHSLRKRRVCVIESSPHALTRYMDIWIYMEHDKNHAGRKHLKPCCHLSPPTTYFTRWHMFSLVLCCTMTQLQQLSCPPTLLTTVAYTQQTLKKGIKCVFISFEGENRTEYENRRKHHSSFENNISALKRGRTGLVCKGQYQVCHL